MTIVALSARSAGPVMVGGRAAGEWGQLGAIPPELWVVLLDDAKARAGVHEKVYRRGPGQCHYWLGALSSSGHGRVRLGVRTGSAARPASIMVAPHVYLYQESRGRCGRCPMAATRRSGTGAANRRASTRSTWPPGRLRARSRAGARLGPRPTPGARRAE